MDEDDVMPNGGSSYFVPREPEDQVRARKKEAAETLQAKDLAAELINHLDDRIVFRDSIESLNVNLIEDPALHQKKAEVNEMLKLALIEERQLLKELLEIHLKT